MSYHKSDYGKHITIRGSDLNIKKGNRELNCMLTIITTTCFKFLRGNAEIYFKAFEVGRW